MACHRQAIPLYISRATMKRELRSRAAAGAGLYAVPVAARSTADTISVAALSELAPGVPDGTDGMDGTGSTGASLLHAALVCKLENPVPHSSRLVRVRVGGDRDRDREGPAAGCCYRVVQVRTVVQDSLDLAL